jgi:hypothetical protein
MWPISANLDLATCRRVDQTDTRNGVTHDTETGMFCFSVRFPGKPPHQVMDTFTSLENLQAWVDGHNELVWEGPSDANEEPAHLQGI